MDVTCSVSDDPRDPRSMPLAKAEATVSSVADADTEGLAELLGARVLAVLLLVSPFFFWGTSMVGMKVCRCDYGTDCDHQSRGQPICAYRSRCPRVHRVHLWSSALMLSC